MIAKLEDAVKRVSLMADEDSCHTWDLSPNDRQALSMVLAELDKAGSAVPDYIGDERVLGFDPVHGEKTEPVPLCERIEALADTAKRAMDCVEAVEKELADTRALLARGVELFGGDDEKIKALDAAIRALLNSAVPHPVEHPTMWRAWRKAEALLGIPVEKSRTIGSADKALEARLLEDR